MVCLALYSLTKADQGLLVARVIATNAFTLRRIMYRPQSADEAIRSSTGVRMLLQHLSGQVQRIQAQIAACDEPFAAASAGYVASPGAGAPIGPSRVGDVVAWRANLPRFGMPSAAGPAVDMLNAALLEGQNLLQRFVIGARSHHGELTPSEVRRGRNSGLLKLRTSRQFC